MLFVVYRRVVKMVSVEIVAEGEGDEETWDDDVAETKH